MTTPLTKAEPQQQAWVVSQYFRPEPGFITEDVAALLCQSWKTTVVTALPNYPRGRIYEGFPKWRPLLTRERDYNVWRLPIIPDHSQSIFRRSLSYSSFLAGAAVWSAGLVALNGPPNLVWTYQTPFTSALPSIWLKKLFGTRLVYTVADLWPESLVAAGVANQRALISSLFKLRSLINRYADAIICSTQGTVEQMAKDGVDRSKLHYVPVWVEGAGLSSADEVRQRRIAYAGNIGPAQQLDTVVRGAAILQERGVDIAFDFFGEGMARNDLETLAASLGCNNVRFHGRVPADEAFHKSLTALGQVVCLRADALFQMTIPSKLPFAFSVGTPILYGLAGEAAALAEASGGAIAFTAQDPTSFADAVQQLLALPETQLKAMSQRLRAYYAQHFARETLLNQYARILGVENKTVNVGTDHDREHGRPALNQPIIQDGIHA